MEELSRFCFRCMRPKNADGVCPHCVDDSEVRQEYPFLPLGTTLSSRYCVGAAGRKNSEGVTYIAYDTKNGERCSVREFFPESLCSRTEDGVTVAPNPGSESAYEECRFTFAELWKKLQRLKGLTAMIEVTDVFTADNTVYAVFAETEERTLRDYLLSTPQGYVEWDQARFLFMPVLSTLGTLHTSGVIHKGINPSAFIFTEDGKLKLTDFSIHQARLAYSDLESDIVDGYAPIEIYTEDGEIGPWTDVYSFSAVLYRALVGSTPISAPVRAENDQMMIPAKFAEKLPPYVINSLINGMQIDAKDRTRNVEQLRANLSASPRAISASAKPLYRRSAIGSEIRQAPSAVAPSANSTRTGNTGYQTSVSRSSLQLDQQKNAGRRPVRLVDDVSDEVPGARTKVLPKTGAARRTVKKEADPELALKKQKQLENRRKGLTVALILLILVFLAGLAYLVSVMFDNGSPVTPGTSDSATQNAQPSGNLPDSIVMQELRGYYYEQIANDNYYSVILDLQPTYENSATVEAGRIMEQSIPVGTTVTRGTVLRLTVSSGPKQFQLPDITNYTYEQAVATLVGQYQLELVRATKYNDGTHVPGTVAETLPAPGTMMAQGGRVTVSFWSDPPAAVPTTDAVSTLPGETQPSVPATTSPNGTVPTAPATTAAQ